MTTQDVIRIIDQAKYQSEAIQVCVIAYYHNMWADPSGQFDLALIFNALTAMTRQTHKP